MKRQHLLVMAALVFFGALNAQNPVYEYSYDAAGNRILRAVVPLHKGDGSLPGTKGASPEEGLPFFGTSVRVFPNPTCGTVRLEASDTLSIGGYRLFDTKGLLLEQGKGGTGAMTLDLSSRADGVYLLDVWLGTERRHFRIVKQ